jgi:hypothetical protein
MLLIHDGTHEMEMLCCQVPARNPEIKCNLLPQPLMEMESIAIRCC